MRDAGRATGRDCAPDASRATGRRRSSVGSVPITMRPSLRGEVTGGGVVVSNDGRREPLDALGSGSLYADHTSLLSLSLPSLAPITMRRVGSSLVFPNRGTSPVGASVQCGSCSVSLLPKASAGPLSSVSANFTTPNSSPKSIVGSTVLSSPFVSSSEKLSLLSLLMRCLPTLRVVLFPCG